MDSMHLKREEVKFEKLINDKYDKRNKNSKPITDGTVNEDEYVKSKFKIAWILKEPYDEGNKLGGGWNRAKTLYNTNPEKSNFDRPSRTFERMAYITYSILNGYQSFSEISKTTETYIVEQSLNQIALININKMPANSTSKESEIKKAYSYWKEILLKQIEVYNPQILIFGNTLKFFHDDLLSDDMKFINEKNCEYIINQDDKLFINAYHPGFWGINDSDYVQGIINVVKKWAKNK